MHKFVWNIPNALTLMRLLLVPVATLPLLPIFGSHNNITFVIIVGAFILAAVTDFLDGYFARKLNQHTEWGAYMDPLIDKFLIWSLFFVLLFVPFLQIPIWTFIVIFGRDILVTEIRNVSLRRNIIFKTSFFAKTKTAIQMIVSGVILIFLWISYFLYSNQGGTQLNYLNVWPYSWLHLLPKYLAEGTALLTAATGIDYIITFIKEIKKNSH